MSVVAEEESEAPEKWERVLLGDISSDISYGYTASSTEEPVGPRMLRITDIQNNSVNWKAVPYCEISDKEIEKYLLSKNDIVFARTGATVGKSFLIPGNVTNSVYASYLIRVRLQEGIDPKYISYFFQSGDYWSQIRKSQAGIGQPNVNGTKLKKLEVPLAPPEQQKRIVAKIEELFSHIDAGISALKEVKQLLKQYRQSVLKAAITGELTKKWREANKDKLEPASQLLERILKERRKKWEAKQLEQFKAKGKIPKDDKWKTKYKKLALPDISDLEVIPDEWAWVNWEAILSSEDGAFKRGPFGSALKKSIFVDSGYKVYEQYCPINDDCSFARYYITDEKYEELKAFAVKAGDFLISCSGVTLGRITQVPEVFDDGVINQALLRVRLNNDVMGEKYFKMFFRSPYFQSHIFSNVAGVAIPNVKGVKELKAIPIPLPPINEQLVISEKVNEKISAIARIELGIETQLKKIDKTKQSILASAFSGCLN